MPGAHEAAASLKLPESLAVGTYTLAVALVDESTGKPAVALACTEIPLVMTPESAPLPMLDSTRILARAALRKAIEG